jgi:hypothetical protein
MANYLTQKDVDDYGRELLDVSQRAAMQAIAPHLQNLQQQNAALWQDNADLRARQAREARRALDQRVEAAVPNYRVFDQDPRWHSWLSSRDMMSGRVRQELLNEAIASGNTSWVVEFFKKFEAEPASNFQNGSFSGDRASERAPSRARRRSAAPGETVYTNDSIRKLYEAHRRGVYANRPDDWSRIEADIFAAQREGRVQAAVFLTK